MTKKLKQVNKKILYYACATGGAQLFTFATLFLFTSSVPPKLYAIISIYETLLFFLQASIGCAIDRATQRFYLDYNGTEIVSLSNAIVLFFSIGFFPICWLLTLQYFEFTIFQFISIYLAAVGYIFHSIMLVSYQFSDRPKLYFLTSICKTFIFFIVTLYCLNFTLLGEASFIYACIVTGVSLVLISLCVHPPKILINKHKKLVRDMLIYSLPFVPTLIAAWVINWSSRLFMVDEISATEIGVFSVAQKVSMIYFLFTQAIILVATPQIFKLLKNNKIEEVKKTINLYMWAIFLAALFVLLFLPKVMFYLLDAKYVGLEIYLLFLMYVNFLSSLMGVSTNLIFSFYKKNVLQMYVFIMAALVSFVMYLYLIPELKMLGVAISLIIPITLLICTHVVLASKATNFPSLVKNISGFSICFGITLIGKYLCFIYMVNSNIQILIDTSLFLIVFCIFVFFYRSHASKC